MSQINKYHAIKAQTLEARIRHRQMIEEKLRDSALSPASRAALQHELDIALREEQEARRAQDEKGGDDGSGKSEGGGESVRPQTSPQLQTLQDEESEKKKKGDGDKGGDTTDGKGSSGGDSGGGPHHSAILELETLALLFFLVEHDIEEFHAAEDIVTNYSSAPSTDYVVDDALGAATLSLNRHESSADIHHPYMPEIDTDPHPPSSFLPSIERHVIREGATTVFLHAHVNTVSFLQNRYGYKIHGAPVIRKGVTLQRMVKVIQKTKLVTSECV